MYKKNLNLITKIALIAVILIANAALVSAGIVVDVTPVNPRVAPPGNATYLVTVTSISTETETVTLSIVNPRDKWTYSFGENDFELTPGVVKTVELSINVPEGTSNGNYFHDVRGYAVVPGLEGVFDEDTLYLNVLTQAIPEFPTIALPMISVLGIVFLMSKRKGRNT